LCHSVHRHRSRPSAFSDTWVPVSLPHVKPPAELSLHRLECPFASRRFPSRPPTGRIPRSMSGLGSFVGLYLGCWEPGNPQGADSPTAPPLPPFRGGQIRKSTKQQRLQTSSVHRLKAHSPLRCDAKIAVFNTRVLWLFIGPPSEFLIQ